MIEQRTLARPYAKAVFEIARKDKDFAKWSTQLETLSLITENNQVKDLLRDVTIPPQKMLEFYIAIAKSTLTEPAKNLIRLLALKRRLILLPEIAALFSMLRSEAENILPVKITSAVSLTEPQKSAFSVFLEKYFGKKITMKTELDDSLMGGYKVKAGDIIIDGSLKGSLEQLKEAMGE